MLKEFLNLFRNEDDGADQVEHPHLEKLRSEEHADSTYLEFLLQQVRPHVAQRLEQHPDSDPILEVATGIFAEMFPDRWQQPDGPLRDRWTPGQKADLSGEPPQPPDTAAAPPAPPAPPPVDDVDVGSDADEPSDEETDPDSEPSAQLQEDSETEDAPGDNDASDETAEGDKPAQSEGNDDEEAVDADSSNQREEEKEQQEKAPEDDAEEESTEPEDTDQLSDGDDDEEASEQEQKDVAVEKLDDEIHGIEELGVVQEEVVDSSTPAGFVSALDETAEFQPPPPPASGTQGVMPLDDAAVLHGARILLAVLLDNDRLPVSNQLSPRELLMAAALWTRLLMRDTNIDDRVKQLARLVEQKFTDNHFSQAGLLLKLFPTNRETRINNDRQLFFEDLITRLGVHDRFGSGSDGTIGESIDQLTELSLDDDAALREAFEKLAETTGLNLHLYTRSPADVDRWRTLVETTNRPEAVWYFLDKIPPRRWRSVADGDERAVETALREHIVRPMVRDYVIRQVQTCYFVLRTVGDTGLEPYLDSFFDWSEKCFDIDATAFMPEIHERITRERHLIAPVFADIYERHFRESVHQLLTDFDDDQLHDAFEGAIERIATSSPDDVTDGNYDLGGFVLDAYLEFEYPEPRFGFGMHRLT